VTNDTRNLFERATGAAPDSHPDLQGLYERRARKVRGARLRAGAVAAVIAVGGVAVGFNMLSSSGGTFTPASGDQVGAPTQNLQLSPGEYYFVQFDGGWGVCQSWWALDDSGRLDTLVRDPAQGNCWGPAGGETYGPGKFYSDTGPVADLSTDPDVLLDQLRQRTQPDGASPEPYADWGGPIEWGLIRSLGELLEAPDVTPKQKAAMMVVAAELSTSVDLHSHDPQGRPAILLALDSEHETHQWWFDPESHQPLDLDGFVIQAAGVVSGTSSTDLNRSFVPQLHP
jgi:hypothetical protein